MNTIDNKGESLSKFIDDNHKLLSAMAILTAITTFVSNISIHWLANTLTFLTIAGIITVWFELNLLVPKTGTIRLFIFRYTLLLGLGGLILYWLLAFREFWNIFLFVPMFFLLLFMFTSVLKQLGEIRFIRKFFAIGSTKNNWQKICAVLYWIGVIGASCYILSVSIYSSPGLNFLLETIRLNYH